MHIPAHFRNENKADILEFIELNNFGILISLHSTQQLIATHIPFTMVEKHGELYFFAHMSKANQQWKSLANGQEVLLIFQGPHTYISSSWYDHVNVPTWNYIAVHVYGKVTLLNEADTLQHLDELVTKHEALEKCPISLESMSMEYVQQQMKGLVAISILVTKIESANKLSQNRDESNRQRIIDALEARGDKDSKAIAKAMKKQFNRKKHD